MKKTFRIWGLSLCAMVLSAVLPAGQAYAGEWRQDETGFWYQEDDGSYPINSWKWIDGNGDGIAECYFFDRSGYLAVNTTTPDGYTVDENGAWVLDGVVQTRSAEEAASLPETAGGSGPSRVTAPAEGKTEGQTEASGAKGTSGAEDSGASGTEASGTAVTGSLNIGGLVVSYGPPLTQVVKEDDYSYSLYSADGLQQVGIMVSEPMDAEEQAQMDFYEAIGYDWRAQLENMLALTFYSFLDSLSPEAEVSVSTPAYPSGTWHKMSMTGHMENSYYDFTHCDILYRMRDHQLDLIMVMSEGSTFDTDGFMTNNVR